MEVPILSLNLLAGDFCNLGGNDMSRDISDGERLTISGKIRLPCRILGSLTKVTEWLFDPLNHSKRLALTCNQTGR